MKNLAHTDSCEFVTVYVMWEGGGLIRKHIKRRIMISQFWDQK